VRYSEFLSQTAYRETAARKYVFSSLSFEKYAYYFLVYFLWPGSGAPRSSGARFIEPPEPPVATPLTVRGEVNALGSQYITNAKVNSAFHPFWSGKLSNGLLAWG